MPVTVLLTNDDGPPNAKESPYVFGLYQHLTKNLGWNVKVVLPSSQKSWIGKAYHIKEVTKGYYYYPTEPDGYGQTSSTPRPLQDGETVSELATLLTVLPADHLPFPRAEWILLDGTPATCANVALHNLYPGQIDLVISGPNLGRNSSSAFSLSSGTVGAALSSTLAGYRSIALSYGTVVNPTPSTYVDPANVLSIKLLSHLWSNWGADTGGVREGEVDLYSINIPLIEGLISEEGLTICWTTMWRNTYGRLFRQIETAEGGGDAGPDATIISNTKQDASSRARDLVFKWAPDMENLIRPSPSACPEGTDGWAIRNGLVSVTPLRASFAEPVEQDVNVQERMWRIKL